MFDNNNEALFESSSSMTLQKYTAKTFITMAMGVLVTFFIAWGMYVTNMTWNLVVATNGYIGLILLVCQLGVVFSLSARMFKMKAATAKFLFILYAGLTGVTFSTLGYAYGVDTIFLAFGMTVLYYGSLAVIGFTTKMNLLRFGPVLFVGLISLVIFNIFAMFIDLSAFDTLICSAGLLIFSGFTAYDTQKMKTMYLEHEGDGDMLNRLYIYSSLQLYLDFINIFLYILRLLGGSSKD